MPPNLIVYTTSASSTLTVSLHPLTASGQDTVRHVLQMHVEILQETVAIADGPKRPWADMRHFDTQGAQCM